MKVFCMNETFTFKKISENDIPLLINWFNQPHVQRWWPTPEKEELIEKFLTRIRSKNTFGYIVYLDNHPIGYIQYYYIDYNEEKTGMWLPKLPENTVGTDQFIGDPDYIGKGYGQRFITAFIKYLQTIEPNITTIIVDPEPENSIAIKCYEKVGFTKICSLHRPLGDALLMKYEIASKHKPH